MRVSKERSSRSGVDSEHRQIPLSVIEALQPDAGDDGVLLSHHENGRAIRLDHARHGCRVDPRAGEQVCFVRPAWCSRRAAIGIVHEPDDSIHVRAASDIDLHAADCALIQVAMDAQALHS